MSSELTMGQGLSRRFLPSLEGLLYYPRAKRNTISKTVLWSDVDVTDVSFWQGSIDFDLMKLRGIYGTFIRAGQGRWMDLKFENNWKNSKRAGLPRGSYWFYDSRHSPIEQAKLYLKTLGTDLGELPLVLDYEEGYGGRWRGWKNALLFLEHLHKAGIPHKKIWIYTGYWYAMGYLPQAAPSLLAKFAKYKLWLAAYNPDPDKVRIPRPWNDAVLWQWGTPARGQELGVQSKEIDMNKYRGTPSDFAALLKELS